MKKNLLLLFAVIMSTFAFAQVGINTETPEGVLDVVSKTQTTGLVLPRVTKVADVINPRTGIAPAINGTMVYDLTSKCVRAYQNDVWSDCFGSGSGGGGTVASITCTPTSNLTFLPATMTAGTAYTGTLTVPYTGGNGGTYASSSFTANGLTFTSVAGTFAPAGGNVTYNITGTPTTAGPLSLTFTFGGQTCTNAIAIPVQSAAVAPTNPVGTASFTGKTCFDVAKINDGGEFGPLASRQAGKADFLTTPTYTYTYRNTVAATNVSFVFINTNGTPVVSINPTTVAANVAANTDLTMTATFQSNLNTTAATLSAATGFTADLYVVYTVGASTFQQKLTANVRDSQCCGAFVAPGIYKAFLCHNLGADTSLDPHDMAQTNAWGLQGGYIQWGRRGPNTTGNSRLDWVNAPNTPNFAAPPTAALPNSAVVSGWSTTAAADNSWRTAGGAKTANDPCPSGFRVPTSAEWIGVNSNNTPSRSGSWTNSATYYNSALHYGPDVSTKLLTLPAGGYRDNVSGTLSDRGINGYYWSSTESSTSAFFLYFTSASVSQALSGNRTTGESLRCIAE